MGLYLLSILISLQNMRQTVHTLWLYRRGRVQDYLVGQFRALRSCLSNVKRLWLVNVVGTVLLELIS